jgi:hypothetical protein
LSDDVHNDEGSDWLLEPPSSGEVHVSIAVGTDVELSPDAMAALETLMSRLQESELSGFAQYPGGSTGQPGEPESVAARTSPCRPYRICNPYRSCQPLESFPCFSYVHCRIAGLA